MLRLTQLHQKGGHLAQKMMKPNGYKPLGQGGYSPNPYNTKFEQFQQGVTEHKSSSLSATHDDFVYKYGADGGVLDNAKLSREQAILLRQKYEQGKKVIGMLKYMYESQEKYEKIQKLDAEQDVYPIDNVKYLKHWRGVNRAVTITSYPSLGSR